MSKIKMTRKEIYQRYGKENVIMIPSWFCNIPAVFEPDGYWCGELGWYCDIYIGRQYVYTYGYQPFGVNSGIGDERSMINTMRDDNVKFASEKRYEKYRKHTETY